MTARRGSRWLHLALLLALILAAGFLAFLSLKNEAHLDRARAEVPRPVAHRSVALERTKRRVVTPRQEPKPEPEVEEQVVEIPLELPGKTQFQRRLVAGDRFHQIGDELKSPGADLAGLEARVQELAGYRLRGDGRVRGASANAKVLGDSCEILGRCRLERIKLANPFSEGDRLGMDLHIRIWTLDGRFPEEEIKRAQKMMEHLERTVGVKISNGYDVLATPKRGDEALPFQGGYSWAAGVYYLEDRYCTIKTGLAPWFRPECLKHELIHAFCHQHRKAFFSSRFICEGLAECLRFYEPGDQGLGVPPIRVKHELSRLLAIIDKMRARGLDPGGMEPGRLLELKPRSFYALRQFSYLVALAAMTYIGAGPIEKAFRQGSDRPIREAVTAIPWTELMVFIERYGAQGSPDRAVVVMDPAGPGSAPAKNGGKEDDLQSALEELGIAPIGGMALTPDDFMFLPRGRVLDEDQVAALLRLFLAERGSLRMFTDCGESMSEGFGLNGGSRALVSPFTPEALWAPGRWGFVDHLHQVLCGKPPVAAVPLLGIFKDPEEIDPQAPAIRNCAPLEVLRWLTKQRGTFHLLLLVASRDDAAREQISVGESPPRDEEEMRRRLEVLYRDSFQTVKRAIRSALVIDLAKGQGDALPLALGISALEDFHGNFAYWDPQAKD